MPDKKSPGDKSPEEPKSGGPKKLIMSGGICVVLIAVGFVVGGKFSGGAPAAAEGAAAGEEVVEVEHAVGEVVALDPININLAEGRYLRIAVALGLGEEVELVDAHGKPMELRTAPASDIVLSTFSGMEMAELTTVEGREKVKHHLEEALVPFYGEDVVAVYFTEFVMQ